MRNWEAAVAAVVFGALALLAQIASRSTWDGIYTQARSARGQEIYARQCAELPRR